MKEICNLAVNNEVFREVEHKLLSQEDKDKTLPALIFMLMKRNRIIKSQGVANGKNQRIYTDSNPPLQTFIQLNMHAGFLLKEKGV